MSGPNDSFLARWARRKEAVKAAEARPDHDPEKSGIAPVSEAGEPSAPAGSPPDDSIAAEAPEPLPRIEELRADSDLSGFLRKGVPEALKAAALRRMWSLDPVIRDYVGPSEYAWDYNNPSSIPGFGPAGSVSSVKEMVSKVMEGLPAAPRDPSAPPRPPESRTADAPVPEHDSRISRQARPLGAPEEPKSRPFPAEESDRNNAASEIATSGAGAEPDAAASTPRKHASPASSERSAPARRGKAVPR